MAATAGAGVVRRATARGGARRRTTARDGAISFFAIALDHGRPQMVYGALLAKVR
jgi:hypothetical protein